MVGVEALSTAGQTVALAQGLGVDAGGAVRGPGPWAAGTWAVTNCRRKEHSGTEVTRAPTSWLGPSCASSVQSSLSVVSDSSRPHGLQHARPPCPSPTPRVDTNSCPLSWWCHPTISSSVIPFSFHLQSFPASRSCSNESVLCIRWPKHWSFTSTSVLPMNIQDWFPLGWTGWISSCAKNPSFLLSIPLTCCTKSRGICVQRWLCYQHCSHCNFAHLSSTFYYLLATLYLGFPGGTGVKGMQCKRCKRPGFNPWVRKIPWKRK